MIPIQNKGKEKVDESASELTYVAPIKYDPGIYSLPLSISDKFTGLALIDSGAALNMMPVSYCRKIRIKKLAPTAYQYRGINGYMTKPLGIAEAMPVRIGNFVYPTNFIIPNLPKNTEIPIIFGRAFLHTAQVNIDMRNQVTSLGHEDKRIFFDPDGKPIMHFLRPYEDSSQSFQEKCDRPNLPHERPKKTKDYVNPMNPNGEQPNANGPGTSKKGHRKNKGLQPFRVLRSRKRGNPTRDENFGFWKQKYLREREVSSFAMRSVYCGLSETKNRIHLTTTYRAADGSHAFTYFRDTMNQIASRQFVISRRADWNLLRTLGVDNRAKAILEKHALGENGMEYYIFKAWEKVFEINESLYRELILEFVASSLSLADFGVALGIYTQAGIDDPGVDEYMVATEKRPDNFNPRDTWAILGDGDYSSNIKVKGLLSPIDRLLHRMLVHAMNSRSSSEEKIPTYDLWLLDRLTMDDRYLNAPYIIAAQLAKASGYREGSKMLGGQYVTRLAKHFGILTAGALASLTDFGEMGLIDMDQLRGMGVVKPVHTSYGVRYRWEEHLQAQGPRGASERTFEHGGTSSGVEHTEQPNDWNAYASYQGLSQQLSDMSLSYGRHQQRMEYNSTETLHQTNWQSGVINQMANHLGIQADPAYALSPLWPFSEQSPPGFPSFEDWRNHPHGPY
ncbi:hypothetical protein OSB04_017455 [Centaurea solstitialis]|uniref:Uncharacterized protein n=1 Tax=Centaurea solstitialis TaxID=347529 RepID=A0AA38T2W9_9ASTR|nr:hypothetical protein OSB04_017455 [Centaurea solstitialis]